jgi:hypothetical protein
MCPPRARCRSCMTCCRSRWDGPTACGCRELGHLMRPATRTDLTDRCINARPRAALHHVPGRPFDHSDETGSATSSTSTCRVTSRSVTCRRMSTARWN